MKNKCLLGLVLFMVMNNLLAQNRSIQFEESKTWQEIVDKAKKENKLIFVDCYTSWCGPCKTLAKDIFTRDQVADFFNETFVNAHFDMEKDQDGKMLFTKYGVTCYPTLLFLDPVTEICIHRVCGAMYSEELLKQGYTALDPKNNLSGVERKYDEGVRDNFVLVSQYLDLLSRANMERKKEEVTADFLKRAPDNVFFAKETWKLVIKACRSPLDDVFKRMMNNREKCYTCFGKETVDGLFRDVLRFSSYKVFNWRFLSNKSFDEKKNSELETYLKTVSYPGIPQLLVELEIAKYARNNDYARIISTAKEALKKDIFVNNGDRSFFLDMTELFKNCKDLVLVDQVIAWLKTEIQKAENELYKSNMAHVLFLLYNSLGNEEEAQQAIKDKLDYFEKGSRQCGGRIRQLLMPE